MLAADSALCPASVCGSLLFFLSFRGQGVAFTSEGGLPMPYFVAYSTLLLSVTLGPINRVAIPVLPPKDQEKCW